MGHVRPTLTPRQSSHEEQSSEGYCIGFRCCSSLQADPSWRVGWLGLKPRRASWSSGRPLLSSRQSGPRWWSRCWWSRWDLTRTQAYASTEASLCLWSTHEADTVSHIWNTGVLTLNLCLTEPTVKHLSQGRAVQLWVAELDIFVCIPGDAPPQQRYQLWRTVVAVIFQSEGV